MILYRGAQNSSFYELLLLQNKKNNLTDTHQKTTHPNVATWRGLRRSPFRQPVQTKR